MREREKKERRTSVPRHEAIPSPAHGQKVHRSSPVDLELLAERPDMHIHSPCLWYATVSPHVPEESLAAHDLVAMRDKTCKQLVLLGR